MPTPSPPEPTTPHLPPPPNRSTEATTTLTQGEIVGIGDSFKSAASDALKRCSRLLGLGLNLWADDQPENSPGKSSDKSSAVSNGNGNGSRLTTKQHSYIRKLGSEQGIEDDELDAMALERFSKRLAFISKADASGLIGELMPQ